MDELCCNCGEFPVSPRYKGWKFCEGCGQQADREMAEEARRDEATFLADLERYADALEAAAHAPYPTLDD